jgi:hypothetical protein
MHVTWYPKNFVVGFALLALLGLALNTAVEARRGAIVGVTALVLCAIVDLIFSVNPAVWQLKRRPRKLSS